MRKNSTPTVSLDRLLACAVAAARTAGDHALRNTRRRQDAVSRLAHDVKLRLDGECQELASGVIRKHFPGHAILGEEDAGNAECEPDAPVQWIIDPIDGTVNFSHGLPLWCCSVAAAHRGKAVVGVVYAPQMGEFFTATVRGRARLNGKPIRVSATRTLAESMVLTGLDKNVNPRLPPFEIFRTLSANIQKARIIGCAALDLCRVACGQADGYFESGIYVWDVAAAGLIVQRAGGRAEIVGRLKNRRLQFVASNGRIHSALKRLLMDKIRLARD